MTVLLVLALVGNGVWLALRHSLRIEHKNKADGYATVERIPNGVGMKYGLETEGTLGLSAPQLKQGLRGFKRLYPGVRVDVIDSDSYGPFVEVLPKTEERNNYSFLRIHDSNGRLQRGIVQIRSDMDSEEMVAAIRDEAGKAQQRYEEDTSTQ